MNRNIELAKNKAKTNNIDGKIEISDKQNKRFNITNNYGTFHFGLYPFKIGTFIDHEILRSGAIGENDMKKY